MQDQQCHNELLSFLVTVSKTPESTGKQLGAVVSWAPAAKVTVESPTASDDIIILIVHTHIYTPTHLRTHTHAYTHIHMYI